MRVNYFPNSRPTKPWVRRWMIWALAFCIEFLPRVVAALVCAPFWIIKDEWRDLNSDVMSFNCDGKGNAE